MTEKKIIRSFVKAAIITLCVLGVLLTAFHFWFREHAEEVIENMVSARSNGKVNLKLKKFRFNYFSRKMEFENAIFYTTDSINATAAYQFKIYKIRIELHSLWQLVFNGRLLIDSLSLIRPDIEAVKLQPNKDDVGKNMSISQEMGRIYNSIHDALEFLGAKRFAIEEGKFSLINKIEKDKLPITISHIHFLVDKSDFAANRKSPDPDNMILSTHDQDISLPDGRHRLSFRNLRINIKSQTIEMDSCTIAAGKSEESQATFRFFFDTLRLSSVDFGTLYKNDLIKADTVYCTKPEINLQVALNDKNDLKKPPSLKKILQPLTGDLQLGYVSILNAGINIVATRKDHTTTFTSQNDNIEITGLRISSDSAEPLVVKNFAMAIRDYETLSRDSTLAFRFDSIKFNNSKVVLSNFTVRTLPGKRSSDVDRRYSIPKLELSTLSWDELLFNRKIKASKAVLYYPVMNYKRLKPREQSKRITLFRDLGNINEVTELQQLQIIDGQLNMELDARTKITLEDVDVLVSSNELLGSRNIKSIQRSLNIVTFGKGILSINDVKAELHHVHFTGKEDQLEVQEVIVYDPTKVLAATANNVVINELYYNDSTKSISIDGLEWQRANVAIGSLLKASKPSKSSILIKNIAGNNTTLLIRDSVQTISTVIQSFSIDELRKPLEEKTTIKGLQARGNNFTLTRNSLSIEAGVYAINDKKNSTFNNACIEQPGESVSLLAIIPAAGFIPDIQEIVNGKYNFTETVLTDPFIHITNKKNPSDSVVQRQAGLTDFYAEKLILDNPSVFIENQNTAVNTFIHWKTEEETGVKNKWSLTKINSSREENNISFGTLEMTGPGFSYRDSEGKYFEIDKDEVHIEAENIRVEPQKDYSWAWMAKINRASLKSLNHFNEKSKGTLTIDNASVSNVMLSSESIKSISALLQNNASFKINNSGGNYTDSNHRISWHNLSFDQADRSLTIDAFSYKPSLPRDSFVLNHEFQADYVTATSGNIHIQGADIESYITDSTMKAGKLIIDKPVVTAYRDATKPFKYGYVKYLPSLVIKRFPLLFSFDTIQMQDATITYSQVDKKTKKTGSVPLTHLNATLSPVRNYNLEETDSLKLYATALLMGKIPVQLSAKESYNDPLAGIHIVLTANAADFTILNPALIPLISAKLKSGYLDTLHMDVKADEYTAYGVMKMNYKNLKIKIVRKGDPDSKTFLTRIGNFATNTFLIKQKNNDKRAGTVYFERIRERSFFNYLVKMTISGVASTMGIKKNKKKIKQYERENKKNI